VTAGGTMIREWNIGDNFTDWLEHETQIIISGNLLQGAYKPRHHGQGYGRYKTAAVLLFAALVIHLIANGYEYFDLVSKNKQLDEDIKAVFLDTFPDTQRIVNPSLQMTQRAKQLKSGYVGAGEFQNLLSSVARALPATQGKIEEINFRDNELIITCVTNDFAGLDRLKKKFAEDPQVKVELLSSGSRDNRVSGRFKIDRAEG